MTIQQRNKIYTVDNWQEFLDARDSGETIQIDEETFDYFLEVLPPVYMGMDIEIDGVVRWCSFGFAEGRETITDFFSDGEGLFCKRSNRLNRG